MFKKVLVLKCLILAITIFIVSCATVTQVQDKKINSYLQNLIRNYDNIDQVEVKQVDVALIVEFYLSNDELDPKVREQLFNETKNYILNEETKSEIEKKLKNFDFDKNQIQIRFQNHNTDTYWIYNLDPVESRNWEFIEVIRGKQSNIN